MNVLHINTFDTGGAAVAMFRLHGELLKQGIESHVLTRDKTRTDQKNHCAHTAKPSINSKVRDLFNGRRGQRKKQLLSLVGLNENYEVYSFPETEFNVLDETSVHEADIICLHWIAGFVDYPTFFKGIRKPILWVFHDMNAFLGGFHYEIDHRRNTDAFEKIERNTNRIKDTAMRHVDDLVIVSPSEWLTQKSQNSARFKTRKHVCIRNCGDPEVFKPVDKKQAKELLNLDPDTKYFLFVASDSSVERKGMHILLHAIEHFPDSSYTFLCVGKSTALKKSLNIETVGSISDMNTLNLYYNAAEVLVLPSIEDNLPNVMLESLLAGTPIIAFSTHGMKEVISNGKNGVVTSNITPDGLKDAMIEYTKSASRLLPSNEIRAQALELFDPTKQAQKYISEFKNLVSNTK